MKIRQKGFYLLELLIAILLFIVVIMVLLQGLIASMEWTRHLTSRTSAFALIQEKMEEVLSDSYIQIIEENYPADYPVIVFADPDFAGSDSVGTRTVDIIPYDDEYKEITVGITWQERRTEESISLYSLVVPKQ